MGALKDEIDAYNAAKQEKVPGEILATMAQATEELKRSGIEDRALKTGDTMPDFELPNQHGERHGIAIDILSDAGNKVAEQLGLVFELPQALRPLYEKFGTDLIAYNGDDSFKLPVPATYIIGQDGVILYDFVNADYTMRLEPSEIVAKLAEL
jgi:peroxiredoxin